MSRSLEIGDVVAFKPDSKHPSWKSGRFEVVHSDWRGEHVPQVVTLREFPQPQDRPAKLIHFVGNDHLDWTGESAG